MRITTRLLIGIGVLVIVVDQIVKFIVSAALPLGGVWSPLGGPNPFIQIIHAANTGVAFGLFQNLGPIFIIVPLSISGAILVYARRLHDTQRFMAVSLGFMLGGALGNVVDRIRVGYVIDFFDIGVGSLRNASNVADWSIVFGVILLAIAMWREERQAKLNGDARSN